MRKIIKSLTCSTLILLLSATFVFAQSEYVEDWLGTWTVTMKDKTTVTWDITHTWVSDTGKSHLAYGVRNPDNVEFLIYFGTMFMQHQYIEVSNETTVYDLPMDNSLFTELIVDDKFESFTALEGNYPIRSGYKGTVPPGPDFCVASYLLGADDPRLDILRQIRDENMATSKTGKNIIKMYYDKSDNIIDICEKSPTVKWFLKLMLESILTTS